MKDFSFIVKWIAAITFMILIMDLLANRRPTKPRGFNFYVFLFTPLVLALLALALGLLAERLLL